jgi:alpha-tubulin suppressor-like RCC1 family protein
MMRIRVGRSVKSNHRRSLGLGCGVLLAALAIVLVGPSPAPALTQPVVAAQGQHNIAAGWMFSQAIKADGSLWLWGYDDESEEDVAGLPVPARLGTDSDWKAVSGGFSLWLALKTDGSLWTMGIKPGVDLEDEDVGILDLIAPTRIGAENSWTAVSAGFADALAVKADGSLWTMEYEFPTEEELIADLMVGDFSSLLPTPTRLGTDSDWVAVSAGFFHSLLLKTDGSLWIIEYGFDLGADEATSDLERAVTRIGTDKDWTAVSAGGTHSLALKADGSLWAWGDNSYGQLGDGTTEERAFPTRVGTDTDWTAVSAGGGHSMALKTDGTLWAWGINDCGQLGDGTTTNRDIPTRIGTSNKWRELTAGSEHSLVSRADGSLWAWGDNSFGQLGDGTTEERHTPVKVLTEVRVPPASGGAGVTFSDVAGSPYETAIYDLAGRGAITGLGDGTFGPNEPVTRQQFAKMIVRALALTVTGDEVCPFADVLPQTATDPLYPSKYVAVCALHGITQGKTATTFGPYASITHEHLITMVARAAALPDPPADYAPSFTSPQFSLEEHYRNARKAAYAGLLDGLVGVGPSYGFGAASTRGECAQMLYNLLNMLES